MASLLSQGNRNVPYLLKLPEPVYLIFSTLTSNAQHRFLSTIAQREEIVRRGLTDRNENVRKMVSKELVPSWLRLSNENVVELLYALDVGNSDGETANAGISFSWLAHSSLANALQLFEASSGDPLDSSTSFQAP